MRGVGHDTLSSRVLKAMSVFGGVQVVTILCSVVRTKLVALWLGQVGVGVFGLYNSVIEMISSITQLGMRNSSVRDIASASSTRIGLIVVVVRRWAWALGLFGAFVTLASAPLLSRLTFGDDKHLTGFILLSVVLLLTSLTSGELAILQGTRQLRRLAKASIWGVMVGLAVSIPMFYYWRVDSVVPSIIAYALATAVAAQVFKDKSVMPDCDVTAKTTYLEGRGFIVLGIYMTLSSFVALLLSYVFMAYLNNSDGTSVVGGYQAGFTIVNRYAGLIFTAIAMEYFPRLTQVKDSPMRTIAFVSHEMKIALWVLMPVIAFFVAADELIVGLLYSDEFMEIIPFVKWAMVGTVFRAVSWCMAFVILARGNGKVFLVTESLSAAVSLALNIISFRLWGFEGLGFAYILWYFIYAVIVAIVYCRFYGLRLGRGMLSLIVTAVLLSVLSVVVSASVGRWLTVAIGVVTLVVACRRLGIGKKRVPKRN